MPYFVTPVGDKLLLVLAYAEDGRQMAGPLRAISREKDLTALAGNEGLHPE